MDIFRYSWSSYVTEAFLNQEARQLTQLDDSIHYQRATEPGCRSDAMPSPDVVITNSQQPVTDELLNQLGSPDLVLTTTSGYDHLDLEAFSAHGTRAARTPEARASNVAEHTITTLNCLLRAVPRGDHSVREGGWPRESMLTQVRDLNQLTVGILGWGPIGKRVGRRLEGQAQQILVHDPKLNSMAELPHDIEQSSREKLIQESNVLTLHADLNPTTEGIIDRGVLNQMPEPRYLINTARGRMVHLPDLLKALRIDRLAGAALDVFPEEPPASLQNPPDNLLVTPHTAGFGPKLLPDLREEIGQTIQAFLRDDPLPHPIEPAETR